MKIFLTGGTGFIGSNFISQALLEEHEIFAIKRHGSKTRISLPKEPKWIYGDLNSNYLSTLKKCDLLLHSAAYGVSRNSDNLEECIRWNVWSSLSLLNQAYIAGIKNYIILGSCFEYGLSGNEYEYLPVNAPLKPVTNYSISKAVAFYIFKEWAKEKNVLMKILRLFHVYGEGEDDNRLWPSLYKSARLGKDFKMTKGEQVRDFIYVKDAIRSIIQSLNFKFMNDGEILIQNIGSGKSLSVIDFCKYWWDKWNAHGNLLPNTVSYRKNEIMRLVPKLD